MNSKQAADSPAPIFILSCERAGSTLLRYIIDTHPEICCPGELHLGLLCEHLGHVVDQLGVGAIAGAGVEGSEERWKRANAETRRMVSALMDGYAARKGKRLWCEKTPRNIAYLDALHEIFPDAKFICLHRNCMDVVHSCMEASRIGFFVDIAYYARAIPSTLSRNAVGHAGVFADSWADKTGKLLAFEREHPEKCFRVKYEELVADPERIVEPMFEFLGVGWDAKLLDAVFTSPHDQGPGDRKITYTKKIHKEFVGVGSGVSRRLIPPDVLRQVNGLLEELDYPAVGPDWDETPSPFLVASTSDEGESAETVSDVEEIFASRFPQRLKERREMFEGVGGVYKFVVEGAGGGVWLLDLTRPEAQITRGEGEALSTITVSSGDLIDIVSGKMNAARAFEMGKVRMAGDIARVVAVGQILLG